MDQNEVQAIVEGREFRLIPRSTKLESIRFTRIDRQAAQSPESAEIDASMLRVGKPQGYIMKAEGVQQGDWVYETQITSAQYFRANVGAMIVDDDFRVLALERCPGEGEARSDERQFVQGGLDDLEEPEQAVLREILEEVGLTDDQVERIGELPDWLPYELPIEKRATKHGRGQVQKWFMFRILVDDSAIKLEEGKLCSFEWLTMHDMLTRVWEIKRPIYEDLAGFLSNKQSEERTRQEPAARSGDT